MPKAGHKFLIVVSGLIWLGIGIFLLTFGISLVMRMLSSLQLTPAPHFSLLTYFGKWGGSLENSAVIVLSLALFVGFLKGRMVFRKSAKRQISRILSFTPPIPLIHIYSPAYYLLIGSMIALGMLIKVLPIASDTRGAIDIAIGGALISGAIVYFRFALFGKKLEKK